MSRRLIYFLVCGAVISYGSVAAQAQQTFELQVPGTTVRSQAELSGQTLKITDSQRQTFAYVREPSFDTTDGAYLGYYNVALKKAIRWPTSGRGPIQIGTATIGSVVFRESQMRVRAIGGIRPRPASNTVFRLPVGGGVSRAVHVGVTSDPSNRLQAAHLDQNGQPQFAINQQGRWKPLQGNVATPLLPGAPVVLLADPNSQLPTMYTASSTGRVVRIVDGNVLTPTSSPVYAPRAHLAIGRRGHIPFLWAVDRDGRIPEFRLDNQTITGFVENGAGDIIPGSPVVFPDGDEALVIDKFGTLRRYVYNTVWTRDDPRDAAGRPFGSMFVPGGSLAAVRANPPGGGRPTSHIFTVDSYGRFRTLYESATLGQWSTAQVAGIRLPPGTPISAIAWRGHLRVSLIAADDTWYEWSAASTSGPWTSTAIARGFASYVPTSLFTATSPHGFAVDRQGALVIAELDHTGNWICSLCSPRFVVSPRLVSREVVANPPLEPATVELSNGYQGELWVLVADLRDPTKSARLKIPAGESKSIRLDRDPGGQVVEVYAIPQRAGPPRIEEHAYAVPPRQLYDVSVYELFLQSIAIDSTKRGGGKIEDVNWSPKSVGIFPIPPGDVLQNGVTLDVYTDAKSQKNPGGVRRIDVEAWKDLK